MNSIESPKSKEDKIISNKSSINISNKDSNDKLEKKINDKE